MMEAVMEVETVTETDALLLSDVRHVIRLAISDNPYYSVSQTVVDRVDEWLAVNDMTQRQLAWRAGIRNPNSLGNWWANTRYHILKCGQVTLTARTLHRLSTATGLTIRELLEPFK